MDQIKQDILHERENGNKSCIVVEAKEDVKLFSKLNINCALDNVKSWEKRTRVLKVAEIFIG